MNDPHLHIPTPCQEAWDGMTPSAQGRHCAVCNHAVIDVTSMPVAEGRRVLTELTTTLHRDPARRTCIRAHAAPSGRLVAGRRKLLTHALAAMLASTMAGCVGDGPDMVEARPPAAQQQSQQAPPLSGSPRVVPPQPAKALMGDVCVPMGKIAPPPPAPSVSTGRAAP